MRCLAWISIVDRPRNKCCAAVLGMLSDEVFFHKKSMVDHVMIEVCTESAMIILSVIFFYIQTISKLWHIT